MRYLCAALLLVLGGTAQAAEKIEAALYWGRNTPPPFLAHTAPADLRDRLRQVFGFHHYQLLKADKIVLSHTWTQWFIPRKDFFICLKPLKSQADEPQLIDYEIYQDGFILAKGKYEASPETPLFINGPDFKNGRLIFVFETR
jgi:hypothetical protein